LKNRSRSIKHACENPYREFANALSLNARFAEVPLGKLYLRGGSVMYVARYAAATGLGTAVEPIR
jgi:hypothetical protein